MKTFEPNPGINKVKFHEKYVSRVTSNLRNYFTTLINKLGHVSNFVIQFYYK